MLRVVCVIRSSTNALTGVHESSVIACYAEGIERHIIGAGCAGNCRIAHEYKEPVHSCTTCTWLPTLQH